MQKQMAVLLRAKAVNVAKTFSLDREGNVLSETFEVESITVLSDVTAAVTFSKEPTKKKAVAWFYYINSRKQPRWEYFFVTYSHLVGLHHVAELLHEVEQHNYELSVNNDSD